MGPKPPHIATCRSATQGTPTRRVIDADSYLAGAADRENPPVDVGQWSILGITPTAIVKSPRAVRSPDKMLAGGDAYHDPTPASLSRGEVGNVSSSSGSRETMSSMNHYMLIGGPLRGRAVDELPDGYEVSDSSDRIAVWTQDRQNYDEMGAIITLMTSAQARLNAQTIGEVLDGVPVLADGEEARRAINDMREANARQDGLLRRMAPDLF